MSQTIAQQVDEFDVGFTAQIGPELSAVFAGEQSDLRAAGLPEVVAVGDTVPEATLVTPDGDEVALATALGDGASVLVLYRGAWCPYCSIALRTYERELLPALRDRGVALLAVSPQTPEGSAQAAEDGALGFPVLSDPGNAFASALGVVTEPSAEARAAHTRLGFDVADSNADATARVPFPTVLVIDAEGVVRFVDVHVDYTSRTEVPAVLAAVDAVLAG